MRGPNAILELIRGRFGYVYAFGQPLFSGSIEIETRFYRKALCKYSFLRRVTFVKNVHADFYGDLDVNFVVTVFDPNIYESQRKVTNKCRKYEKTSN